MRIDRLRPLPDAGEQAVREAVMSQVEADPEFFLSEYARRFGNVLNADNAANLFGEYNEDPARYRVAVHPAAQWIRNALFTHLLQLASRNDRKPLIPLTAMAVNSKT